MDLAALNYNGIGLGLSVLGCDAGLILCIGRSAENL
jgi:hypothetical protein